MRPVTLKQIAEQTGYSVTTVSRALAGYDDVAESTRERIVALAEELGYYPNLTARQLQKRRTDTVGLILPTHGPRFSDPFFSEILAGIGNELARRQFDLLLSTRAPGPEEIDVYRRMVLGRRVDGLIVLRTRCHDQRVAYLIETGLPFVVFGRTDPDLDFPYLDEDGQDGLHRLTSYLISLGHHRIGYISAPLDLMFGHFRFEGYRQALAEHDIPYDEQLVAIGDLTQRGGVQAATRLLSLVPRPTAVIAANDLMALGAITAAREAGLEVGVDLTVAGFDDIPLAEHTHPALTTMRQPIYEIGKRLSQMLVALIEGHPLEQQHILLKPELIVRASSGPPPT